MSAGPGLGWPETSAGRTGVGLGWPGALPRPTPPSAGSGLAVSGAPGHPAQSGRAVSRETARDDDDSESDDSNGGDDGPMASHPAAPHPGPSIRNPRATGDGQLEEAPDTPIAAAARSALRMRSPGGVQPVRRPGQTRVLVVANQKGGVGKTTSTVNLAAALSQYGQRVLVIDLDPQGNASTALGIEHPAGTPSMYDVLVGGQPLTEVLRDSPGLAGVQVAPSTIDLAGAEIELVPMVARENRLRRAVTGHLAERAGPERIDYVLIDCPPSLGLLTLNALVAAREVLIAIQCEYYALEGLGQLVQTIDMVRAHLNEQLRITTVLLTMYDARTRLAAQVAQEVRTHFGELVLPTAIPRSVRISEAPSYGQTVLGYDPGSVGALSYLQAAREMSASLHD